MRRETKKEFKDTLKKAENNVKPKRKGYFDYLNDMYNDLIIYE